MPVGLTSNRIHAKYTRVGGAGGDEVGSLREREKLRGFWGEENVIAGRTVGMRDEQDGRKGRERDRSWRKGRKSTKGWRVTYGRM
jgi:hypothetical protein